MFNQFEDLLLSPLVKKLNEHGVNVDAETIKRAVANSPQVITQIEAVLLASSSSDRISKIVAIINQAAQGTSTGTAAEVNTSASSTATAGSTTSGNTSGHK